MADGLKAEQYLGDGVYAGFDGYQIVLKANSHVVPTDVVYLEPGVMAQLVQYAQDRGVLPKPAPSD